MVKQRVSLRCLGADHQGMAWESDQVLRIGRLTDLEAVLRDDSVSRQHAEAVRTAEGWVLRDLGSTNGTFLNGIRVGRAGQKLKDGDIVQCGNVLMAVKLHKETRPTSVSVPPAGLRVEGTLTQTWDDVLALQDALRRSGREDRHKQLLALLQVGRTCPHAGSLDTFAESVLWEAAEALGAPYGCLALVHPTTDHLTIRAEFGWTATLDPQAWLKNNWIGQALRQGQSLLWRKPPAGGAGEADTVIDSVLCALLRTYRRQHGVLCLARPSGGEPFDRDDLAVADALALCVSDGIENLEQVVERERNLFIRTLTALAQMVELRRGSVDGRPRRVTDYALLLAGELKLSPLDCYHLQVGTPLLELGKIGLTDDLLGRPAPPAGEAPEVRECLLKGAALLESIPGLDALLPLVRNHRENWDGSGYPDNLAGERIPLPARIVAVADAFDALTAEGAGAGRLPIDEALAEIQRGAGTRFDPGCVQAFLRLRPQIERLFWQRGTLAATISKLELDRTRESLRLLPRQQAESGLGAAPARPG